MSCLDDEELLALSEQRMSPEAAARARDHVDACDDCRQLVADVIGGNPRQGESASKGYGATLPAAPTPEVLPRGVSVGRYVLLELVGRGGMGVVYSAYDPELDRRMAVKLVRADAHATRQLNQRLVREAQALARVSHPNVLTVYDAGLYEDQVFVATELVDGGSLAEWLRTAPRSWREVLDVFVAAGRGLAAAHAADLVHRDFKPENVLIGKDGRIRVADFGLARPTEQRDTPSTAIAPLSDDDRLTRTGARIGTPAYMAPEQIRGEQLDARSDQFSFCVALYEALFGVRPFAGSGARLLAAIEAGQPTLPLRADVPRWLRSAVEQGLRAAPAERHASMDALLHALHADRNPRLRRALFAGSLVMAIAGIVAIGGYVRLQRRTQICRGAERSFTSVWDDTRRALVRRALVATRLPYADTVAATVEHALDDFRAQWLDTWVDACEATRVRGAQSEELLDRRMTCLDEQLKRARALSDLLAQADADTAKNAANALSPLAQLADCSNLELLRERTPPPRDAAVRARVDDVKRVLARSDALAATGHYEAALPIAGDALAAAESIGYAPLVGQALLGHGQRLNRLSRFDEADAAWKRAVVIALSAHDTATAAEAWLRAAILAGYRRKDPERATDLVELGGALIKDLGSPDELERQRLHVLNLIATRRAQFAEAETYERRALALAERIYGPGSPEVASHLSEVAMALERQGDEAQALALYQRALAIEERVLGPRHPNVAMTLYNMAIRYNDGDDYAQSLAVARRALDIDEAALGAEHPDVADCRGIVIDDLVALGRFAEARPLVERALAVDDKQGGENRPKLLEYRGRIDLGLGQRDAAIVMLERALALPRPAGRDLPEAEWALAQLIIDRDRARALRLARQARALFAHDKGETSVSVKRLDAWLAQRRLRMEIP